MPASASLACLPVRPGALFFSSAYARVDSPARAALARNCPWLFAKALAIHFFAITPPLRQQNSGDRCSGYQSPPQTVVAFDLIITAIEQLPQQINVNVQRSVVRGIGAHTIEQAQERYPRDYAATTLPKRLEDQPHRPRCPPLLAADLPDRAAHFRGYCDAVDLCPAMLAKAGRHHTISSTASEQRAS